MSEHTTENDAPCNATGTTDAGRRVTCVQRGGHNYHEGWDRGYAVVWPNDLPSERTEQP